VTRLPAIATAVVLAIVAGWWAAGTLAADRKLASLAPLPGKGDYRITLDFAPERFHQQRLQDAGRLVEVRERDVFLRDVAPAALRDIAGRYWVESVHRWDGK
jgi:hypothetical protein